MVRTDDQLSLLLQLWRAEGVGIAEGALPEEIQEFEKRNSILLPEDFKNYLLIVNGMYPEASRDTDSRGFCFWPLRRIVSTLDEFRNNPVHKDEQLDSLLKSYFLFADYLQWSWGYAIQLAESHTLGGEIFKVDEPKRLAKIADSFSEFINLYLNDSRRLYDSTRALSSN